MPDRISLVKQFRLSEAAESLTAPLPAFDTVNADSNGIASVRERAAFTSRIIALRTPEWELGIEEFGAPLPRDRVPRASADEAMFAPACGVRKVRGFEPLLNRCNLLVHDEPHWYGAIGAVESIVNWDECLGVMLTGDVRTIARNARAIASVSNDDNVSIWAVTALPMSLDEDDKRNLETLGTQAEMLINLSLDHEQAPTESARYPSNEGSVDGLYHQVVVNLVEAITVRGLVCIDICDIRTCLGGAARIDVGAGSGRGKNRGIEACEAAIARLPAGKRTLHDACGIFVHVVGSPDMSLGEWDALGNLITEQTHDDATVAISAILDSDLADEINVMVLARANPANR